MEKQLTEMEKKVFNAIKEGKDVKSLNIKSVILSGVLISLYKKGLVTKDNKLINNDKDKPVEDNSGSDKASEGAANNLPNIFTLNNLAEDLGLDPRKVRKVLRDNKYQKEGKYWEWKTEEEFNKMKELFKDDDKKPEEPEQKKA